jgi:hypothetical protein
VAVLLRPSHDPDPVALDEQVTVRRGDVDPACFERLHVLGVRGRQRPGPREDLRQGAVARDVEDDQHGGAEVGREVPRQRLERPDAARRCAGDYNGLDGCKIRLRRPVGLRWQV